MSEDGEKIIPEKNIPLIVDLDGTLINTDLLHEGFLIFLKKNIFNLFLCLIWLLKGKTILKKNIAEQVDIPYKLLPVNKSLVEFLKKESEGGRKIILATASYQSQAVEISKLIPVFDEIVASDDLINMKGEQKRKLLVEKFGEKGFDYVGNSKSDLKIFASCRFSYLVNPSVLLTKKTANLSDLKNTWHITKTSGYTIIKSIRAYQWIKNLLIFIPLVTSHTFHSITPFLNGLMAFLSFSFIASAGYIINDLMDLNADRTHPEKCRRPLASGELSIVSGIITGVLLICASFIIASTQNIYFIGILLLYFFCSIVYSLFLKKLVLYDVFMLAMLYSIRIFAGGIVIDVPLSFWLIAFSAFIFLSLALVKRYSELIQINDQTSLEIRGRQYSLQDINLLEIMGIVSGFMSIVVLSLYINSKEVTLLYTNPKVLWALSILFLFWISRIWHKAIRGEMTDDPILFAIKDKSSYFIFGLVTLIIAISI
jgi:4-hydroxybenzoate polyprenyltransferase/phosphoserine phosphatase